MKIFRHLSGISAIVAGHPRHTPLEQRIFNAVSILNGITNLLGSVSHLFLPEGEMIFWIHCLSGVCFLYFYFESRIRDRYQRFVWPLIWVMFVFLAVNIRMNAGLDGGAHYYMIPALVIAIILTRSWRGAVYAFLLFGGGALVLFAVETYRPDWILKYENPSQSLWDAGINYWFVQLFNGFVVLVLASNLNEERDKSDRLLLNILPQNIAEELKMNDYVEPVEIDQATILFTDFVGFTSIASELTPRQLIDELDLYFSEFDRICEYYRIEKIKTIGDAYMAAGGVVVPSENHALQVCLAAIDIREFVRHRALSMKAAGNPPWQIRIGIHSGSLYAGVIGKQKFAFDVWGDSVNTASRMESSGEAERINISESTYRLVHEYFECECRGEIGAKNKGRLKMYFLNQLRQPYIGPEGVPSPGDYAGNHRH